MTRNWTYIAALPLLISGNIAQADEITSVDGRWYAGIETGLVMVSDIGVSAGVTAGGFTITGSGDISFDNGMSVGGIIGHKVNDWVALELEASYLSVDYKDISGSITVSDGTSSVTVSGAETVDGDITAFAGLVNVLLTPKIDDSGTFKPFVGAGLGFLDYDDEVSRIGTTSVTSKESNTAFAYQFKTGMDIAVNENVALGIAYTYSGAETGDSNTDDAVMQRLMVRGVIHF
jgi:Opacity protein and related surface antigens